MSGLEMWTVRKLAALSVSQGSRVTILPSPLVEKPEEERRERGEGVVIGVHHTSRRCVAHTQSSSMQTPSRRCYCREGAHQRRSSSH